MPSYQDIDARLIGVEDRVKFIMKITRANVQVGSQFAPAGTQIVQVALEDLYRELKYVGGELREAKTGNLIDGGPTEGPTGRATTITVTPESDLGPDEPTSLDSVSDATN